MFITERERQVLICLGKGLSKKETGKILYISEATVKMHTQSLYEKLEVHDKLQAVVKCIKLGYIDIKELI